MKINEDLKLPSLNKSLLNAITDATEIDSIGNNTNGYWMRLKNGIMIVYGSVTLTSSDSRSAGGLTYYSSYADVALTKPFINTNIYAVAGVALANMNIFCQGYVSATSVSQLRIYYINTNKNESRTVNYIAIGTWK